MGNFTGQRITFIPQMKCKTKKMESVCVGGATDMCDRKVKGRILKVGGFKKAGTWEENSRCLSMKTKYE